VTYALGIDIGTTYTAAAVWRDGRAETVPLADRAHSIPSTLFLREDGVMLVGEAANRRGATDPTRVARDFKDRLGSEAPVLLGDTEVLAQDLTGYILRWVVDKVIEREGGPPAHTTLTCPATWGEYRRQLMTEAAAAARLSNVGVLAEPVAAAVHYASREHLAPDTLVGVYDLGGGTFDATVVRKTTGGFEVQGVPGGDETIGGTDFDEVVMAHVASTIGVLWHSFDVADPTVRASLARVRDSAVEAKEALSADVDATIPVLLPDLTRDVRITRGEFESAIRIPILRTVDTFRQTLAGAGVEPADLHTILLVGGSSRIPLVSRLIAAELGVPVSVDAHPKYAVCLGAAVSAGSRLHPGTARAAGAGAGRTMPIWPPLAPPGPTPADVEAGTGVAPATAVAPQGTAPPAQTAPPGVQPSDAGEELLAAEPVSLAVDLTSAGITEPLDTLLYPAPQPVRAVPPLSSRDEALRVEHTGDARRGRRVLVLVAAAIVAVLIGASLLGELTRPTARGAAPGTADSAAQPAGSRAGGPAGGSAASKPPELPAAVLQPQAVPAKHGDEMHAVTAVPGGLVAVGGSTLDLVPRAWRYAAGAWTALPGPTGTTATQGAMNGVATGAKGGLVAVGWLAPRAPQQASVAAPTARRPAIWTSGTGQDWRLVPVQLPAGLGELSDIAAVPGGGFVVAGTNWSVDKSSGDGAILTSTDGAHWRPVPVQGLDGPGPTTLRRLLAGQGGSLLAVGTRLGGAVSQSVIWTSPDAEAWTVAAALENAGSTAGSAWGLTRLANGSLLVSGFRAAPDGTTLPLLWSGATPSAMQVRPVTGAGTLHAVTMSGGALVAIGSARPATDPVAAAWTVQLPG